MTASPASNGRIDLVGTWCDRYRQPLISYFMRRVANRAEAEDLAQDVFVRILSSAVAQSIDNAEAFVFTTALNLLRDRSRRSRVQVVSLAQYAHRQNTEERVTPERQIIGEDSLRAALASLSRLNDRSRRIFEWRQFEEKEYEEIAALAGLSLRTVEKHMNKVRTHLVRQHEVECGNFAAVRRK
jgi:RNA polymerase sigma factor (sigma-70 family)